MQIELLDRRTWTTRTELANAIFEWIEGFDIDRTCSRCGRLARARLSSLLGGDPSYQ
jgi:hypothetical protein